MTIMNRNYRKYPLDSGKELYPEKITLTWVDPRDKKRYTQSFSLSGFVYLLEDGEMDEAYIQYRTRILGRGERRKEVENGLSE